MLLPAGDSVHLNDWKPRPVLSMSKPPCLIDPAVLFVTKLSKEYVMPLCAYGLWSSSSKVLTVQIVAADLLQCVHFMYCWSSASGQLEQHWKCSVARRVLQVCIQL